MKSPLHTTDPLALRYFMSETLFSIEEDSGEAMPVVEEVATDRGMVGENRGPSSEVETAAEVEHVVPTFRFTGANQRKYLFITDDSQSDFMSEAGMDAFLKTIGARKMELADVAVFNVAHHAGALSWTDLLAFFKPRAVVLLGPAATRLGVADIPANSLEKIGDIPVFQTYSFDVLLADMEKKTAFWPVLKSLLI